ncbi:LuxR C-terminal-related transcriptional regulator [Kitasatospora sp. NPDC058478]|uniref:LuxR C-terminal-related transcriptional regulator n=1 Tax=unclassified Kitasatospora TaxID=2633591 RepID=UPI0036641339
MIMIARGTTGAVHGKPCPQCGTYATITKIQQEVLRMMALGASNLKIGRTLRTAIGQGHSERRDTDRGAEAVSDLQSALTALGRANIVDTGCRTRLLSVPDTIQPPKDRLPPRCRQSVELLASGLSYKAIARELFLSDMTVKSHLHQLYTRIGAQNGAHAVYLMHALNKLPTHHPCRCTKQ